MVILQLKSGTRRFNPSLNKITFPKVRHVSIVSITLTESNKLIAEKIFENIPTAPALDEITYTGDMALFIFLNLRNYYTTTKSKDGLKKFIDNSKH